MKEENNSFRIKPSLRRAYFYAFLYLVGLVNGFNQVPDFESADTLIVASIGVLVVLLLYANLARFCTLYTMNDEFIEVRSGILARQGSRMALRKVTDFMANQSLLQRILQMATVNISSAGGEGPEIVFRNITMGNAKRVIGKLTDASNRVEQRYVDQRDAQPEKGQAGSIGANH